MRRFRGAATPPKIIMYESYNYSKHKHIYNSLENGNNVIDKATNVDLNKVQPKILTDYTFSQGNVHLPHRTCGQNIRPTT